MNDRLPSSLRKSFFSRTSILVCAGALLLAANASPAAADRTVAVDLGSSGNPVARAVAEALTARDITVSDFAPVTLRGAVKKRRKRAQLVLRVIDSQGVEIDRARFRARNLGGLARNVRNQLWKELGSSIESALGGQDASASADGDVAATPPDAAPAGQATAGAASADGPATDATADDATTAQTAPADPDSSTDDSDGPPPPAGVRPMPATVSATPDDDGPEAIRFRIGAGVYTRSFEYTDDIFAMLNGYELGAAALLAMRGEWYPGRHWGDGIASIFGFGFEYEAPLALNSDGLGSDSFPTRAFAWRASALIRFPLGGWSFGLDAGYGVRSFSIDDSESGMPRPEIPNVDYQQLVFGGHIRTPSFGDKFGIELRGGYHQVLETGEIGGANWFPNNDAMGAFAELSLEWALGQQVAVYGSAMGVQQGFTMNPVPGDARVAGGATDRYLSATFGLRYAGR